MAHVTCPSAEQSRCHQDCFWNVNGKLSGIFFSRGCHMGTDSYYPTSITLSIAKFVSIKSSISNTWAVAKILY